ncbi:MAG: efflux RND transporter periplasmic adaptor subunit [Fimbriimonas sp.]
MIVVGALALAGCGDKGVVGTSAERAQKIEDPYPAKVERRDLVGYTLLQRPLLYVPPESQAVVYPKYRAPVEQVMASVGQQVNRGEVLIQLSFPNAEAAYAQAQQDVKAAETAYANAKSEFGEPVRQAKLALEQARKIERDLRARTDPTGDASAAEEARMQREAAEQAVREAERAMVSNASAYKDQLELARQAMQESKQGVKQGSLRAPISGTITVMNVRAGDVVGEDSKQQLVKIVNLADIKIKAYVPSDMSANLVVGKEVTMAFKELANRTFDGKISRVSVVPTEGGQSAREITIDFRNDEGLVKEGFTPDWAGVKVGQVKDVLTVPRYAVDIDATGKPTVKVLEDEKWVPRVVETGMSDGKYIEIKKGLKEGETVQVTPEEKLKL